MAKHQDKAEKETVKPSLEGVHAKIARAKQHLDDLALQIGKIDSAVASHSTSTNHESQERVISATIQEVPEITVPMRIIIGDVVHCLAAALDHLVFQLSLSYQIAIGNPDARAVCEAHRTHFPIFCERNKDNLDRVEKRIKLMAPEPAALIRLMQPYQADTFPKPLNPETSPLWILFKLDVIDKHRLVLAVNQLARVSKITIRSPDEEPEVIDTSDAGWQPFKQGTKLFELTMGIDAWLKPDVEFHAHMTRQIQFAETGLACDGRDVMDLLSKLIKWVESPVLAGLAPFVG